MSLQPGTLLAIVVEWRSAPKLHRDPQPKRSMQSEDNSMGYGCDRGMVLVGS